MMNKKYQREIRVIFDNDNCEESENMKNTSVSLVASVALVDIGNKTSKTAFDKSKHATSSKFNESKYTLFSSKIKIQSP